MNLHHDTITVHGRTDECQKLRENKQGGCTDGRQQLRENMQGGVRTVRHGGMEEQVLMGAGDMLAAVGRKKWIGLAHPVIFS